MKWIKINESTNPTMDVVTNIWEDLMNSSWVLDMENSGNNTILIYTKYGNFNVSVTPEENENEME